jgi:hypothetical protein
MRSVHGSGLVLSVVMGLYRDYLHSRNREQENGLPAKS